MSQSLKLFVFVLVLTNLLLIGMLAGHLGRKYLAPSRPTVEEITASLPAERRAAFDEALAKAQTTVIPMRQKIDTARRESLCIIATDPFDKKAYLAKTDELHRLHQQLAKQIVAAVTETAPNFTPQERIAFMDLLRPPPPPRVLDHRCTPAPTNTTHAE